MLLVHEFEYLKSNLEMRTFPILLTNNRIHSNHMSYGSSHFTN